MPKLSFFSPCLFGLESALHGELKRIGAREIRVENGRVFYQGDLSLMARANIELRIAERVLLLIGEFPAQTFEELFEGTFSLPWEDWIGKDGKFPVKGRSISSDLHSIPDCQSIIKKAIAERLKKKYRLGWMPETGTLYQVQFFIHKNQAFLMIDTSGEPLYKRGYRQKKNEAPMRETLAAGIVDLSRIRPDSLVYDPFCGSGTLLIESAMKARHMAPSLHRDFAAQSWGKAFGESFAAEKEKSRHAILAKNDFQGWGSDCAEEAIAWTEENAKRAGVVSQLQLSCQSIENFRWQSDRGIVLCNPPYGERMLQKQEARKIYRTMGKVFLPRDGRSYYILSSDEQFETYFGRKADKKRKLYNGMLRCYLYMYF